MRQVERGDGGHQNRGREEGSVSCRCAEIHGGLPEGVGRGLTCHLETSVGFNQCLLETRHSHGDPTSLAPHERLTDLDVLPREKPHTGAAAREQPRDSPVIER